MRLLLIVAVVFAATAVRADDAPPTATERRIAEHVDRLELEIKALQKENTKLAARVAAIERQGQPKAAGQGGVAAKPAVLLTREEFEKKIMTRDGKQRSKPGTGHVGGLEQEQVLKLLGPPSSHAIEDKHDLWTYKGLTIDPLTNKPDKSVTIDFWNDIGRWGAQEFKYEPGD